MARNEIRGTRQDDPPAAGKVVSLVKIKGTTRMTAVILSQRWEGFNVHWHGGRTCPHVSDKKLCQGCLGRTQIKWVGFLHMYRPETETAFLIEITKDGAAVLEKLKGERKDLRGMRVHFYREYSSDFRPVLFDRQDDWPSDKPLPLPKSAVPTLLRLWGVDKLD